MIATVLLLICTLSGASFFLSTCPAIPIDTLKSRPILFDGLDYGSKLEVMQKVGVDAVAIPYYLQINEGSVQSMIVQLSVLDPPSKYTMLPCAQYRTRRKTHQSSEQAQAPS